MLTPCSFYAGCHRVPIPPTPPSAPPPPSSHVHLNSGFTLWLQRYWGMLVKRFLTSLRFWQAAVTQLLLPLFFVGYAMVLARTILFTDDASDPLRRLGLRESSLGLNRTLFWAEFGGEGLNHSGPLLAGNTSTSLFDFSDEVIICLSISIKYYSKTYDWELRMYILCLFYEDR